MTEAPAVKRLALWGGAALAAACTVEVQRTVFGTGEEVEEPRAVESFASVVVSDDLHARVVSGVERPLVVVRGYENLLGMVRTEVRADRLVIEVAEGFDLDPVPQVLIHAPELRSIAYRGSGKAEVEGLAGEHVELALEGSGSLRAQGEVTVLRLHTVGSGDVDLLELTACEADVDATGSGVVCVRVAESLDLHQIGSVEVSVAGGGTIERRSLGCGSVRRVPAQE